MSFHTVLLDACHNIGVELSTEECRKLEAHLQRLVDANQRFNLTRITDPLEAAAKHYADSLSVVAWARMHARNVRSVLDVGTGGGFPAVPIAVARPDWQITAVDATAKKARFVGECAQRLALPNLRTVHAHLRHWKDRDDAFDLVTFRAVAKLAECLEQGAGRLAADGRIVCYKTNRVTPDESEAAVQTASRLRLRDVETWPYEIALGKQCLARQLFLYRRL